LGAIAVGLLTVLKNQNTTSDNVSDSQDTTVVAANFVQDVQGASMISTSNAVTSPPPCGPVVAPAAPLPAQPILSLQWTTTSVSPPASTLQVVSYDVQPWGLVYRLVRYICENGSAMPTRTFVISRDVQPGLQAVITGASCMGLSCNPSAAAAAAAGWASTAGISGVTLNVETQLAGASGYQYTLVGVPRVSSSASRPFSMDAVSVDVWCTTVFNPPTCPTGVGICSRQETLFAYPAAECTSTSCSGSWFVQAVVYFDDFSSSKVNDCSPSGAQSTCGSTMSIYSWIVHSSVTT